MSNNIGQENSPDIWRHLLPEKQKESHKYDNGSALVYGAPKLSGATRLVASACARMGIGLVTVVCDPQIANVYRSSLPAHIMVRDDLNWNHQKISVKIYGSGGLAVLPEYNSSILTVLDANALENLPQKISPNFILTPHEGEFDKAFPNISGTRQEKAVNAAQKINAYIILKGPLTIIASPEGNYITNNHASPLLATAGSGDVLAGMIGGLVGQKMPILQACSAAVWIHGQCAIQFGKGLVAEDLVDMIPLVLQKI